MSVSQIPNLTPATALNGSEQLEAVQAGSSVRVTAAQIATYTQAQYPVSTITSVTATSPLSSTTVSNAVTISLPLNSVTNAYLAAMPNNTIMGNFTGGSSQPVYSTVSTALDSIGSAQGGLLYRGASDWLQLGAGPLGYVLTGAGAGGAPTWTNLSLGSMATQNANAVAITGGTISGVAISTSTINQTPIGATTPSTGAFTDLSASGTVTLGTISGGTWQGTPIAVAYGGTGASTASGARTNLGAAASGANSDITSLSGLTTPLSAPQGGTGFASYTTGDILYADSSSTLARLNDVATGNALISGGVGATPSWGKIGLTTHVSGTLGVANGGTGATSLTGYLVGNGVGAFTAVSTIPNAGLTNSTVTIGSTTVALGATTSTLAGLTTVTLTQDPTAALEASTKQYVDNQVATVSNTTYHTQSSYATTADLGSVTYSNGTGGVNATITQSGAASVLVVDGYTFLASDVTNATRVLVKDQSSGLQNGIYVVTNQGSGSANWQLTRAADFNTVGTGPNYIETGAATFVTSGSVNASTGWVMTTTGTITVGSTALTWAQTSSSSSVTVTAPLNKVGSVISLNTVTVPFGGTGLTTLTQYGVMLGNGTGNVAFASPGTSGYALLSNGASANPSFGQLSLTAGVTGTLPVANGGTGTSTAFTAGSVVFAGPSGTYAQDNAHLFWDDTNNRLGINSAVPNANMTIVSNTQTAAVPSAASLPAGTDLYIMGANAANTRITQDAYGTGNYAAYTGRQARGTGAAPTASQTDDILVEVTGRGYGATGFSSNSVVRIDMEAAEAFTDTAQGTYMSFHTTALGATSPVERFRIGPSGQLGIGGATYGTSGYVLTSAGASAAPTWSQVSATSLSGVLPVANGGTNISSYTIGDLIYASGTTTLSKLADVATGNALISGGVGVAPSWGKIDLTTHVSGVLPIANGGTNLSTTPTDGQLLIGSTAGAGYTLAALTQGTNIAITNGAGSISIATSGSPSFATSVTTPIVYGGTAASSSLTLQSTSGVGTSDSILFKVGNAGATTAMTINTSGNVGIGTGSPSSKLEVLNAGDSIVTITGNTASGNVAAVDFKRTGGTVNASIRSQSVGSNDAGEIFFQTRPNAGSLTERMRIDSSGNVGIGVTPQAWVSGTYKGLEVSIGNAASVNIVGGDASIASNAWISAIGTSKYLYSSVGASKYQFYNGTHIWSYAASGTAGGTISWSEAMRIDASGSLLVGATTQAFAEKFQVYGNYSVFNNASYTGFIGQGSSLGTATASDFAIRSSNALAFLSGGATERMRIDASGNVNIGSSAPVNPASLSILKQTTALSGTTNSFGIYLYPTSSGLCYIDAITSTSGNSSLALRTYNNGTYSLVNIDSTGNLNIATSGVSAKLYVNGNSASNIYALTDGTTITPDFSTGNNFSVTLGGNRTLANPTNMTVGQSGIIYVTQDGTGSRTLAYGAYWKFPGGTAPTLTTTASATDALVYTVRTSTSITVTAILNIG